MSVLLREQSLVQQKGLRDLQTRGAGESVKPGVKRSGTPGSVVKTFRARGACDSGSNEIPDKELSPASRAQSSFFASPGVPLRSTPRSVIKKFRARGACDSGPNEIPDKEPSPASRAQSSFFASPGVALRSTPGFMLTPTSWAKSNYLPVAPYLSISPNTISSVPIIATTSATRWPMQSFFNDCKLMKHGGRTRMRQGCCVPSDTK